MSTGEGLTKSLELLAPTPFGSFMMDRGRPQGLDKDALGGRVYARRQATQNQNRGTE